MFDIVYVSYNSKKWLHGLFSSWRHVDYDLKQVNIYIVDNHSDDEARAELFATKEEYGPLFAGFEILLQEENYGFGKANNIGFSKGKSEIVCFLNIDTEMFPDTLTKLDQEIRNADEKDGLWEFRQFPYEHPKIYDVLTGETSWSSGAAFAVRRDLFSRVHGFDEKIFMYAEDVDLSWRIKAEGFRLIYCPRVRIKHYAYQNAGEVKPVQYINSIVNNLLLRYRFGTMKKIVAGHVWTWRVIKGSEAFPGSRKMLIKAYLKHFSRIAYFRKRGKKRKAYIQAAYFTLFDYSPIRDGAFYENKEPKEKPLVSVIVRTCGRPAILREALISLRRQTYENLEIVVVEDGAAKSESMIKKEFSDLNIIYYPTIKKVGRSKAGNIAMKLAHGKYLNFLDDDDLLYADHVEVLVSALLRNEHGEKAAYSTAFETPIEIKSRDPYVYEVKSYNCVYTQCFDPILLCHHNYIPIQSIMFEKSLFEQYGGLDENTDALEDWDLWLRYSTHTDFIYVFKTTSIYRVPAEHEINENRQKELDKALEIMREKHKSYIREVNAYDLAMVYQQKE